MTKLICVGFVVLAAGGKCIGQPLHREDNPMKYALIHHEPVNERWTLDHAAKQYTNDVTGYQRYVSYVVFAYGSFFSLNKAQESAIQFELTRLYKNDGITIAEVHEAVASTVKRVLSFRQYLEWKNLKSYPEDSYFKGLQSSKVNYDLR